MQTLLLGDWCEDICLALTFGLICVVYNTCLLATLPRALSQTFLEKGQEKLSPLFCVGVNDMPLVEAVKGGGYIAC